MFARVASFEGGDFERLREEGARRLEGGGAPSTMRGYLVLADEEKGRRLFVSFYDSREELEEGDKALDRMGDEIPEEVRGRRTSVEVYEVVAHKAPAMV